MVDLLEAFDKLNWLYESPTKNNIFPAIKPDLTKCKLVKTDVVDIRGELETNSCLLYSPKSGMSPILTRVQVRTLILKEIDNEYFILGRRHGNKLYLPGGGYDLTKDAGDPCKTAEREAWEEFNFKLTDIRNPQLYSWSCRESSFVTKHVANEQDRWTGYLTILITAKYAGTSDNDNPEELGKWRWYSIDDFESNKFYRLGLQSMSLSEAIHPDKQGRSDLGQVSYLCDSLKTLRLILSSMEIQKTYVKEVRYELVGVKRGRKKKSDIDHKQYSLSTSTNLTGHADRRPDKWGFGIVLDGARLSKYYDIEPYNHAHFTLPKQYITKIVKLKDGRVIITISYYGNREVKQGEWLYKYIVDYIDSHPEWAQKARKLDYYVMKNGVDAWRFNPFRGDTRFENIKPSEVEDIRAFVSMSPSQNCLPLKELDRLQDILDYLAQYSNFNEEEERIWLEDDLLNFVQIPKDTLVGIILPEFFKEDYELATPTNVHLAWLKKFVTQNNLEIIWHQAVNKAAYEKELTAGQHETAEQDFDNISKGLEPKVIVEKAKQLANQLSLRQFRQILPMSQVATAVVKKAITDCMQNLTAANYNQKYDLAYKQAVEDGFDCKLLCDKTKLIDALRNLFNYYCPDKPKQ